VISVNQPLITKQEINNVRKALSNGWFSSSGPQIIEFENRFKNFLKKKYCVLVSSGTAALEIAVKSLELDKSSEIIIPNFTIISNASAVIKNNLKIIPIDCNPITWNMNINYIQNSVTKNTKAIIATHIYGYPLEMDKIKNICKKKKIILIEDSAEMIGHSYMGKKCGSFGDIGVFSFYANKHITMGEGGALVTDNKILYEKFKDLRNLSFGRINRFNHENLSWNYRITNIQAAFGLPQLKRIKKIIKKKKNIGKKYYALLKNNKNIYIQKPKLGKLENIYWVIGILLKKGIKREKITAFLKKKGIETRPFFWPMSQQKVFKKMNFKFKKNFKISEDISKRGFYLPSGLGISDNEIRYVCKNLNSVLK